MDSAEDWTREYFLKNQEECIQRLKSLSVQDKVALGKNLHKNENGKLCLISNCQVMDVLEPEFYCETYKVKSEDGSFRTECGKYSDKLNIGEDESVDEQSNVLGERQVVVLANPSSMNKWVKEKYSQDLNEGARSYTVKVDFYSVI